MREMIEALKEDPSEMLFDDLRKKHTHSRKVSEKGEFKVGVWSVRFWKTPDGTYAEARLSKGLSFRTVVVLKGSEETIAAEKTESRYRKLSLDEEMIREVVRRI